MKAPQKGGALTTAPQQPRSPPTQSGRPRVREAIALADLRPARKPVKIKGKSPFSVSCRSQARNWPNGRRRSDRATELRLSW
ncbi:hypothetical protein JJD41_11445 [Oxynema sp. CENA135]|uniref:hypothetical protein n=1 Tax=Oxynema sp. CENA135 TaxID=984206 RepID=UPI00190C2932|nr:hypothetical protein [Oxynema sp. CENA135]MBK4730471.1 hypothetical protein [Oxynema sp. CENA135]